MIPALNPLVLGLKESSTLAINSEAIARRKAGEEIFHFGFGQSPFPVPAPIRDGLIANASANSYLPTLGLPALREAVAHFYQQEFGYTFTADQVCVGPGSKELIFQTIFLMEGPLIVPAPSWVSYGPQAALRGKQIAPIITKRENSYRLQPEELDAMCATLGQCQKLLILNNPNNPTGCVYSKSEIAELAEICRAYNVIVISDEIYAMVDFTKERKEFSLAQYYPEGTIVSGGLSKSFSAGGYRLGVMLIPSELSMIKTALKSIISETFSSVSAPIQYAALAAYGQFETLRSHIETMSEIHGFAGRYLCNRFTEMKLHCPRPEGSFYLFPDFDYYRDALRKRGIITGQKLCQELLEKAKVAVLPGSDFYLPATSLGVRVASVDYDGASVLEQWPGTEQMTEALTEALFPNLVRGCNALEAYLRELE